MNSFKQFNIKPVTQGFVGDKIKIVKIIGKEIEVHDYKIEESKVFKDRGTGKCLHLQIKFNGEMHIVFTSAVGLINAIEQIPRDGFPFMTIIIQENDRYYFS